MASKLAESMLGSFERFLVGWEVVCNRVASREAQVIALAVTGCKDAVCGMENPGGGGACVFFSRVLDFMAMDDPIKPGGGAKLGPVVWSALTGWGDSVMGVFSMAVS